MAFFYELCDLGGNGFRRYATAFAVQFCPFAVLVELNPVAVDKHDIIARVQESFSILVNATFPWESSV